MDSSTHTPDTQQEASPSVAVLWLYIFGFVVCSVVVFLLPAPYSLYLLVVLVAASMGFGVYRLIRAARPPRPRTPAQPPVSATVTAVPAAPQASAHRAPAVFSRLSAYRSGFAAVFALTGFALMIAAAFDYRTLNDQAYLTDGSLKMIAGGLMIGVAVRVSRRLPTLNEPVDAPLDHLRRFWWVFAGLGTLFLMTLAEINGQMLHMPALQEIPTPLQFGLLVGGVLLLGYGFGGAPSLNPLRIRIVWSTIIPLGAILALALFLRVWQNDVSLTYLLDELHYSDAVLGLEGRPYQPILTPMSGQAADPWIYPFLVTNTVAVLGHTFAGFRFTSAIIGILTVLATYGLGAAMFDRKTALLGALILATLPPHVHFSRVTQSLITDPLFGTLAIMFVARALRKNRRIEWAMAGVALGLTQYFYEGGRLLFPPLMLGFIVFLALNGKMRGRWRGGLTMLAIFVIVAIPIYYTLIGNGKPMFGRYDVSGVGTSYWADMFASGINLDTLQQMAKHLLSSFMMFGAHPDMSVFYGGEQALVLDYLLPFFLFGVFYLLWRYPASVVIVPIWIAVTGLGNGVMRDTLASTRYYVVLPAVALAITSGVRYLFPFVWGDGQPSAEGATKRGMVVRWAIPAVAVGAIAAAQVGYYFGPHLAYFNVQVREAKGYRDGIDAVNRALALPGNTQIFLVGRPAHDQNVPRNWLGFLSQDGDPMRYFPLLAVTPDTISAKYLNDLPRGVNYAFYVDPTLNDLILLLQRTFPGISQAMYSPFSVPAHKEYVLFFVPSETIPLSSPLKLSHARP